MPTSPIDLEALLYTASPPSTASPDLEALLYTPSPDLEALLYTPSPRTKTTRKSLTPPSNSDSPHLRMLYNKLMQEKITRSEYDQLKKKRQLWHAENSKLAQYNKRKKTPPPPTAADMLRAEQWRKQTRKEIENAQARKTISALNRLNAQEKKIKDAAELNRVKQGMLRLAKGTRKHKRSKHRRTKHKRSKHRRTKRNNTKRNNTKHRRSKHRR